MSQYERICFIEKLVNTMNAVLLIKSQATAEQQNDPVFESIIAKSLNVINKELDLLK